MGWVFPGSQGQIEKKVCCLLLFFVLQGTVELKKELTRQTNIHE